MSTISQFFAHPLYLGVGGSQGTFIPPQALARALRSAILSSKPENPDIIHHGRSKNNDSLFINGFYSFSFQLIRFASDNDFKIFSPEQTILKAEPVVLSSDSIFSFKLSINNIGNIILNIGNDSYQSFGYSLSSNEWHKIFIMFDTSFKPILVLADEKCIISVAKSIIDDEYTFGNHESLYSTSRPITGHFQANSNDFPNSSEIPLPQWPFGSLKIGYDGNNRFENNSFLSHPDLNSSCFRGALAKFWVGFLPKKKVDLIFEIIHEIDLLHHRQKDQKDPLDHKSRDERSKSLSRSAELALELSLLSSQSLGPSTLLPDDSFPLPSRTCRPLLNVDQMNDWKASYYANSKLKLDLFNAIRLQNRHERNDPLMTSKTPYQPKVILCHDFKGGYYNDHEFERGNSKCSLDILDQFASNHCESFVDQLQTDSSSTGSSISKFNYHLTSYVPDVYTFTEWSMLDIFVYFSHSRVTIPPVSWIQASHKNGVPILGTLIMEWEEGSKDTLKLLAGKNNDRFFYAQQLVDITKYFQFDGWLINIEHKMQKNDVDQLIEWLDHFSGLFKSQIPNSHLVWYDSVTIDGELKWQSELNDKNKPFFKAVDYFFTDYHWKPEQLKNTLNHAEDRFKDVFIGIDVHGRGTFGGGGYDCHKAIKEITSQTITQKNNEVQEQDDQFMMEEDAVSVESPRAHEAREPNGACMNVALFAPAWTLECQTDGIDAFNRSEDKFWHGIDYLNVFGTELKQKIQVYYRQYEMNANCDQITFEDVLSKWPYPKNDVNSDNKNDSDSDSNDPNNDNPNNPNNPNNDHLNNLNNSISIVEESQNDVAKSYFCQLSKDAGRFPGIPQAFDPISSSSKWSFRHLLIETKDIYNLLFDTESLNEMTTEQIYAQIDDFFDGQPEICISSWFKGNGPNFEDYYRLRVYLLNENDECINEFDSGTLRTSKEWQQITFNWRTYLTESESPINTKSKKIRKILWIDAGKDAEGWHGYFGSVIDRPSLMIKKPSRSKSIASFINPRSPIISTLPFVSSFDVGEGSLLYFNGDKLENCKANFIGSSTPSSTSTSSDQSQKGDYRSTMWYNMAAQSLLPLLTENLDFNTCEMSISTDTEEERHEIYSANGFGDPTYGVILKDFSGSLVDASRIDGGVYHGSSCLVLKATVKHPKASLAKTKTSRSRSGSIDISNISSTSSDSVSSQRAFSSDRLTLNIPNNPILNITNNLNLTIPVQTSLNVPAFSNQSDALSSSSPQIGLSSSFSNAINIPTTLSSSFSSILPPENLFKRVFHLERRTLNLYRFDLGLHHSSLIVNTASRRVKVTLLFRPIHIPTHTIVLINIHRRNSVNMHEKMTPLSFDLMAKENRDASPDSSSFGWQHFSVVFQYEKGIVYDGMSVTVAYLSQFQPTQGSLTTKQLSSPKIGSPRIGSPRFTKRSSSGNLRHKSSHNLLANVNSIDELALVFGFLKLEDLPCHDSRPNSLGSTGSFGSVIIHDIDLEIEESHPLRIDYRLSWSQASLENHVPFYHITFFWNVPKVPSHLKHLGPPHFIVTMTTTNEGHEMQQSKTRILFQSRTWTPSWTQPDVPAIGTVHFSVSMIYPDFSSSNMSDRVKVEWPLSQN